MYMQCSAVQCSKLHHSSIHPSILPVTDSFLRVASRRMHALHYSSSSDNSSSANDDDDDDANRKFNSNNFDNNFNATIIYRQTRSHRQ
mmetsp:Transcript_18975/g.39710  ORF Transcript_18975/g.39710 Transcript_18975/m.39710 type:complete len:88 (-) Transcript_18975:947-1210(-)